MKSESVTPQGLPPRPHIPSIELRNIMSPPVHEISLHIHEERENKKIEKIERCNDKCKCEKCEKVEDSKSDSEKKHIDDEPYVPNSTYNSNNIHPSQLSQVVTQEVPRHYHRDQYVEQKINQVETTPQHTSRKLYDDTSQLTARHILYGSSDKKKEKSKNIVKNILKTRSKNTNSVNNKNNSPDTAEKEHKKYSSAFSFEQSISCDTDEAASPELWTDETVQQLIDFSDICNDSADRCKKSAIRHKRCGHFIQIMVVLLGALAATTSIGSADNETKNIISTISGSMVAVLTSVQSFLKFPQRSETEANSCLELERMARGVRIELSKAKEFRIDPYKYIIKLENQREKILRRVGIEDD